MEKISRRALMCAAALAVGTFSFSNAQAQAVDFAGKRIELIIPLGEGGGTDTYARFIAGRLAPYLPGKPDVIVRNIPGGGTMIGTNAFQKTEPNGETIFTATGGLPLIWSFDQGKPEVQYDPSTWEPLLASPLGYVVYINSKTTGIKDLEGVKGLMAKQIPLGMTATKGSHMLVLLSLQMLGFDLSPVIGVDGGDAELAFERGEFPVNSDSMGAYLRNAAQQVKAGEIYPLFSYGVLDANGKMARDPAAPDVPTFNELYTQIHGKEPDGQAQTVWMKLFSILSLGSKSIVIKKDTAPEIKEAYHQAFEAMIADPNFAKEAEAHIGGYPQNLRKDAQAVLDRATSIDDTDRKWLADWYLKNYNVTM